MTTSPPASSAPAAEPAEAAAGTGFGHEVGERVAEVVATAAPELSSTNEGLADVQVPAVTDTALAHCERIK
jgi:hypothetical protein